MSSTVQDNNGGSGSAGQFFSRLPKALEIITVSPPQFDRLSGFQQTQPSTSNNSSTGTETVNGSTAATVRSGVYSPDGKKFAYAASPKEVKIIDSSSGEQVCLIDAKDVVEAKFSPRSTYLLTWERAKKDESDAASGNWLPNLKIWDISGSDGVLVTSYLQKSPVSTGEDNSWSVQFSYDEKYCARLVSPTLIHFYDSKIGNLKESATRPVAKFELTNGSNISQFLLSPGQNHSLAVFIPEKKGRPASVAVYQIPNFGQAVSQKTFFKADRVTMKWNSLGTALLVLASTDVDQSGRTYYGETNLYLLGIAGSYDSRIQLNREGPIHDFNWSPNSREFGVVYGFMPAETTIFDSRGNSIHSLPLAPRNHIQFSPNARFLLVAGFGNLPGTVDIFDRQNRFTKISSFEASNTSVCQWSPEGTLLMTAITSPRLRVDNGVKIWHYTGKLLYNIEYPELLGVGWKPSANKALPSAKTLEPAPEAHPSVLKASGNGSAPGAAPKPAGVYRPPHARGTNRPTCPVSLLQLSSTSNGTAVGAADTKAPSKTALKNQKKRENKHKQTENSEQPSQDKPQEATAAETSAVSPEDKKIRSYLKKLRAIEDLKKRQSNGEKLEDTQIQKINTESTVRESLVALGWTSS